ncbi:MAG: N-acetyl sugar amidotransferase [Bacteroidetes bacterium]|nr:N-acetyl sugar amidotransferase [Bacteroidota bacterium]
MDTTAVNIEFDSNGYCNFCINLKKKINNRNFSNDKNNETRLRKFVEGVKKDGAGKPYDCIIGVSGGADSSYSLYYSKKLGLRPLAVHMDNGWNSELAVNNIRNLVDKLEVDLHTHVIDWEEYRSLMQAFFDANVIDIELLYDNAMLAVNYQMARKYKLKYILSGSNTNTEGMAMPDGWNWFKYDKKNIKKIGKKFSDVKLKTFPAIGTIGFVVNLLKGIKWVRFLDYFDYNKALAMGFLTENFGFKQYPYKHYESVFTRFYQGYILPEKFKVDKRKLHLSALICSGQMSRDEALEIMKERPYPTEQDLDNDIEYFLKKMGWNQKQMDEYLAAPEKPHRLYGTEKDFYYFCIKMKRKFRIELTKF